ncbi:TPA: phosphomethylpyrimidine kinase, partial [Streptococcus pneumoniae]|nr:phosphomethylpyrimidine kinase [Streptococcus pneumoniae]
GFVAVTCLTALTEKGFEVFPTDDTIFQHELDSLRDVLRAFFYTNRRKGVKMIFK